MSCSTLRLVTLPDRTQPKPGVRELPELDATKGGHWIPEAIPGCYCQGYELPQGKKKPTSVDLMFLFPSAKCLGEIAQKNNLISPFFLFSSPVLRQSRFAPGDNGDCVT